MARFYGNIGYGTPGQIVNGVWSDNITELPYMGDILSETRNLTPADQVNDNIQLSQRISVVADAFALQNFHQIKYVEWAGVLWTVVSAAVEHPRLILSLGGVWNGNDIPTP